MLQSGSQFIPQGATSVLVTFPTPFPTTPAVVLTMVRNLSADVSKAFINVEPVGQSSTTFTASLASGPATANYELVWMAGSASQMLDLLSNTIGRKLSSYGLMASLQGSEFQIPALVTDPVPALKLISESAFWASVVRRAASVPTSATDGGRTGLVFATDGAWGYIGGEAGWGRFPVDYSPAWDAKPFFVPFREGEQQITAVSGQISYRIDFDTPFAADPAPKIQISLSNLSGGNVELLTWQLTTIDLSGFVITFNSPPSNNDLAVYYMARQVDLS